MAEKDVADLFPYVFRPTVGHKDLFYTYFGSADFAQLQISKFWPNQSKSFSKLALSANVIDVNADVCKCMGPANLFMDAFSALGKGEYTEDVKEAIEKLGKYLQEEKKHVACISKMMNEDRISEKQILLVYARHLFEPLLPHGELLIDKNIGLDVTKCPFCPRKMETIKSASTSFGVPGMWHGRADIVLKHGRVRQTVTVRQGTSESTDEPAAKRLKMDDWDVGDLQTENSRSTSVEGKNHLNWNVLSKWEQDQDPVPQLLSRTIVNAFLVAKSNRNLKNVFIPSFLVTPKGVMIQMYNVAHDSLFTQVDCRPLLINQNQEIRARNVFTIWLALNFDKFPLDQSDEIIQEFLTPCGFRNELVKYGIQNRYEEEVNEGSEKRIIANDTYLPNINYKANEESLKVFTFFQASP